MKNSFWFHLKAPQDVILKLLTRKMSPYSGVPHVLNVHNPQISTPFTVIQLQLIYTIYHDTNDTNSAQSRAIQ